MRIEKLGVVITAGTGSAETVIKVMAEHFELNGAWRQRAEIEELRDALTAALAEYDAMTATTEQIAPGAPAFTVGQVLTGDEDLPIGAKVNDKDGEPWDIAADLPLKDIRKQWAPFTIVSLP